MGSGNSHFKQGVKFNFLTPSLTVSYTAYPGCILEHTTTGKRVINIQGGVKIHGLTTSDVFYKDAETGAEEKISGVTNGTSVLAALSGLGKNL
jgi:hypothetical protein